jgi:hypothetical protein
MSWREQVSSRASILRFAASHLCGMFLPATPSRKLGALSRANKETKPR